LVEPTAWWVSSPFCEVGHKGARGYLNTVQMGAMSRKTPKKQGFPTHRETEMRQLTAGEKERKSYEQGFEWGGRTLHFSDRGTRKFNSSIADRRDRKPRVERGGSHIAVGLLDLPH